MMGPINIYLTSIGTIIIVSNLKGRPKTKRSKVNEQKKQTQWKLYIYVRLMKSMGKSSITHLFK